MKQPDENHERLRYVLADLLDDYPGVVIVVRTHDGGALVVSGGSGDDATESDREYGDLLRDAPGIIRLYTEETPDPARAN